MSMSTHLPERASLEFLKKLAKERLLAMRASDPAARLAQAQFAVAREYGFSSWRAVKAEIDRRRAPHVAAFFEASKASTEHVHHVVGCGEDHRFEGQKVAGAALVADGRVVHLNLYRN